MVTMQMKMALSSSLVRLELTTERDEIGSRKKKNSSGRSKKPQRSEEQRGGASPSLELLNHRVGREETRVGSWRVLKCCQGCALPRETLLMWRWFWSITVLGKGGVAQQ